jgi:hypothetical protein
MKINCPDCCKDWGHGLCATCQGSGYVLVLEPSPPNLVVSEPSPLKEVLLLKNGYASGAVIHCRGTPPEVYRLHIAALNGDILKFLYQYKETERFDDLIVHHYTLGWPKSQAGLA